MTVAELIEVLKKFEPSIKVELLDYEYGECEVIDVVYAQDRNTAIIKS